MKAEWLTWRRYQRSFKQRMAATVGQYWQAGYASGTSADLYYEHEWSWDDVKGLRYGLGHTFRPYDGKRDSRNYGSFGFYGRFQ
jgi:biofilm PGA synthesis protein PgaA